MIDKGSKSEKKIKNRGRGMGLVIEFYDKLTKNPNVIFFFLFWDEGEAGGNRGQQQAEGGPSEKKK